jgi:hypothetical protein
MFGRLIWVFLLVNYVVVVNLPNYLDTTSFNKFLIRYKKPSLCMGFGTASGTFKCMFCVFKGNLLFKVDIREKGWNRSILRGPAMIMQSIFVSHTNSGPPSSTNFVEGDEWPNNSNGYYPIQSSN